MVFLNKNAIIKLIIKMLNLKYNSQKWLLHYFLLLYIVYLLYYKLPNVAISYIIHLSKHKKHDVEKSLYIMLFILGFDYLQLSTISFSPTSE